jgi:hypothetical protein
MATLIQAGILTFCCLLFTFFLIALEEKISLEAKRKDCLRKGGLLWNSILLECTCKNNQLEPPLCTVLRCQNGGLWNGAKCECFPRFTGIKCEEQWCQFGNFSGDERLGGQRKCDCLFPENSDLRCQITSCKHGSFANGRCICEDGFDGAICSELTSILPLYLQWFSEMKELWGSKRSNGSDLGHFPNDLKTELQDEVQFEISTTSTTFELFQEKVNLYGCVFRNGKIASLLMIFPIVLIVSVAFRWLRKSIIFCVCDSVDGNVDLMNRVSEGLPQRYWKISFRDFEKACKWHNRISRILGPIPIICFHQTSPDPLMSPCVGPVNPHSDNRYQRGWKLMIRKTSRVLFILAPEQHDEALLKSQFQDWNSCRFFQAQNDEDVFTYCMIFLQS